MKTVLLEQLICPRCLPAEVALEATVRDADADDLRTGRLHCGACGAAYPIAEGIAVLTPQPPTGDPSENRYERPEVVSSYFWSHYGDILKEEFATDAYRRWADLMEAGPGWCLDTGCAVGRFSFEMARKFDFVVGLDTSLAFIRACRELAQTRRRELALKEEGHLTRPATLLLPPEWPTHNLDFIVADAQALPFRRGSFAGVSSLNVVDKVPRPLAHLAELNRVAAVRGAQLLFSDPFSWSTDAAPEEEWLGGTGTGPFAGRGLENILALLEGRRGDFSPPWQVAGHGPVWWKIRTHRNHFELIRSWYIQAGR